MQDILQQIQSLKEDFMNLIEVEGLGNPAVDVPPSTNKIKKDRRTKDGKVELVSVEDELFPYDGNKREQYRQKIIDTINNMIQGTATLEDLLQIVRQKKAPLKEALDLVEAIKDEVKNHHKYTDGSATFSYKGNDYSYSPKKNILGGLRKEGKSKDDRNPVKQAVDSSNKEFEKARKYNYDTERQSRAVGKKINKEVAKLEKTEGKGAFPGKTNDTIKKLIDTANVIKANRADADKNFTEINKRQQDMADDAKGVKHQMYDIWNSKKGDNFGWKPIVKTSEALKEAMEVLESIISEKHVFPKKAVEDGNKKYLEADKKNNEATRLARKGFEKLNKKIKELEGKGIDTDVDIEPGVSYGGGLKKEYQQALKTADNLHKAQREADIEETKARNNQRKLRAEGLKGVVMRQFDYVPTKKGDSFNVKKVLNKNEALEEALRILEGLFVNDGRGDLIDNDVMNKPGWTRKTIENGIIKVAKGLQKKVSD